MSKESGDCGCKDYSLLTANTGIQTITSANNTMDGSGATTVITAGSANGTIIKSIRIKAAGRTGQVTKGMVRLFVSDGTTNTSLYKEVPIPVTPSTPNTPTPVEVLKTFELKLDGDLKLTKGYSLLASTQNSETFNIITEGLDWAYPALVQTSGYNLATCCNFIQETANNGIGTATVANTNLDGSGTIVPIYTASTSVNGSFVKKITVKALQNTNPGMIRLFISPSGSKRFTLFQEVMVNETVQSGFDPSLKFVLEQNFNIPAGYVIGASTEIGQAFAFTTEGWDWTYPIS